MPKLRSLSAALVLLAGAAFPIVQTVFADSKESPVPVTLINAFEVEAAEVEKTIEAWKKARNFLSAQPGYVETNLHRAITPEAKFQLINIAKWESPAAFKAAIGKFQKSPVAEAFRGTVFYPALYVPVDVEAGS